MSKCRTLHCSGNISAVTVTKPKPKTAFVRTMKNENRGFFGATLVARQFQAVIFRMPAGGGV